MSGRFGMSWRAGMNRQAAQAGDVNTSTHLHGFGDRLVTGGVPKLAISCRTSVQM
jgi:hypothetical protein